jgi:signal transduction histidine kinase
VRDINVAGIIIDRAQDILFNRFLTINIILIFFIVILGFLLTYKTLEPIKSNMEKQKRFIADASHELRTPIAIMISGLEVNLENKKLDLDKAKKTLESTLEEMREFSALSNKLLDMSKYDTPLDLEYEKIEITELIKSIVEKNKSLAVKKNIEVASNLNVLAVVEGNKMELTRVFYNLLDNAIKYTKEGGKISFTDKLIGNKYVLTVADTGIGIPEIMLQKIFDPFFRADTSRNTEGAGLGLTLAKKIIENHKGTISVKSEENKGTSIIISLPITSFRAS